MLAIGYATWQAVAMKRFEDFPAVFPETPLSDAEVKDFTKQVIVGATHYLLGTRFRNITSSKRNLARVVDIGSPNELDVVRLGIYVGNRPQYGDTSVVVATEGLCPDITDVLPQDIAGPSVWDVSSFVFPTNMRNSPTALRFLIMRNKLGGQITPLNAKQQFFLNQVADQFGMKRNSRLNTEDLFVIQSVVGLLSKSISQDI